MKKLIGVCALVCALVMSCSANKQEIKFGEITVKDWIQGDTIIATFIDSD
ncbi:hypothetical protein EZS27_035814 [termite gut metagenome]|uniref:Uncharacterized protein n=1 Tax=termite gut metagenome TaxID=433724 RepID=A0A5J4PXI8_9ZZZZ